MAATTSTRVPPLDPLSGSVIALATRTRGSIAVTVPIPVRHEIRTCSSIVPGSGQPDPTPTTHDSRGTTHAGPDPGRDARLRNAAPDPVAEHDLRRVVGGR